MIQHPALPGSEMKISGQQSQRPVGGILLIAKVMKRLKLQTSLNTHVLVLKFYELIVFAKYLNSTQFQNQGCLYDLETQTV